MEDNIPGKRGASSLRHRLRFWNRHRITYEVNRRWNGLNWKMTN